MGGAVRRAGLASAAAIIPWIGGALHAQAVSVPPAVAAEAVAPTREEIQRPAPTPGPRSPSRLTVEGGVQHAPCALSDARFASMSLTLSDAVFDNLHDVSATILRPAFADLVGKTVPIAAVCEIRDAAATILRNAGYLAAVQVPPQRIEGGVVHFDVLMPKLVSVHVRGDAGKSAALIASYLQKLVGHGVFNQFEAERYLLFTRDLPGYDVRLTLRPADSGVPGEVVGEVSVLRQPYAVDFNVQDYGSRSVGRFGGLLRGELYDVLGLGDRLSLGGFSTADFREQQVVQAGYDVRLGGEGLSLGSNFTYAWTHPTLGPGADARARTLVASLGGRYPFVRSQTANLSGGVGFDFVDQDVRFNGTLLTRDHVRTAYFRLTGDLTDRPSMRGENGYSPSEPRLRATGAIELRQGLKLFDETPRCGPLAARCLGAGETRPSRLDARPRASIVRLSGSLEWRPTRRFALAATPQAQYAFGPTLQYEQFSAGNYTVGRGYDPGAMMGDRGVGSSFELRYGTLIPHSAEAVTFQPYAFVDAAWAWHAGFDFAGPRFDRLVSAGGGVRAAWGARARIDLAAAVPIERVGAANLRGDTRVLLSLTTRLLPWSR